METAPSSLSLILNGERRSGIHSRSVGELVRELELPAPLLLIEHNDVALRREEWDGRVLREGDRVEVIRVVAGG